MIYQFNNLTLDTERYSLSSPSEVISVEPQVFDLLVSLIENRDRVVSREELLENLWKGKVVSDSALGARIKEARKAVGDSGEAQIVIKTIHGRGYRFVATLTSYNDESWSGSEAREGDTAARDKPAIVILPFRNLSGNDDNDVFTDALTENITTELSRFRDFNVISSYSAFAYKSRELDMHAVCSQLGADFALVGNWQGFDSRARVCVQLVDATTGHDVWTERYEYNARNPLDAQDTITEKVVATLGSGYAGRLRKAWRNRHSAARGLNLRAFDLFCMGLNFVDLWTPEGNARGRACLEEAVRLDPDYAKAHAKLAWTHVLDAIEGWSEDPHAALERGRICALRAVDCDDNESWAHWSLAGYYIYVAEFDRAERAFERALAMNPNDPDVLTDVGFYMSYLGNSEKGIELALKAMALNPHHAEYYDIQLVQIYFDARRYDDAVSTFSKLNGIRTTVVSLYLAASYAAIGQADKAKREIRHALDLDPTASVTRWTQHILAPYKFSADREHFRDHLQMAGLPD